MICAQEIALANVWVQNIACKTQQLSFAVSLVTGQLVFHTLCQLAVPKFVKKQRKIYGDSYFM